jgi:hypothetical protein
MSFVYEFPILVGALWVVDTGLETRLKFTNMNF